MEHVSMMQYLVAGALGLGLAACSGFRVFVPLLAAALAVGLLVFLASRVRRWRQRRAMARQPGVGGPAATPVPSRFA